MRRTRGSKDRVSSRARARMLELWRDTDAPTLPGATLPRGPWSYRPQLPSPSDHELYRSFDFALRIGDVLLSRGAAVADVEASVMAAARAMGLRGAEVEATFTSILLSVRPEPDVPPMTSVRVVRTRNPDYNRLSRAHTLLVDLTEGRMTRDEAIGRLEVIETERRPYPRWFVTIAWGLVAASIVVILGGQLAAASIAFVSSAVVDRVSLYLAQRNVPEFFLTVMGGFVATMGAVLAIKLGANVQSSLVVAGGIVALLPGVLLVAAVQDALSGFLITGSARLLEVLLLVGGLVSGVALGLSVADKLDVPMAVVPAGTVFGGIVLKALASAVASGASAVAFYAPRRVVLTAAAAGAAAQVAYASISLADVSPQAASAVAAMAVGIGGYFVAGRLRALPLSIIVPAIAPLLPGLTIYRGMLLMTSGSTSDGLVVLLDAASRGIALAAGVLFAELVGQPAQRRMLTHRP